MRRESSNKIYQRGMIGGSFLIRAALRPLAITGLALLSLLAGARVQAKNQQTYFNGNIVSIRGNIIQIHPAQGANLARVVVDGKTAISVETHLKLGDLRPGWRIVAWGQHDAIGGFNPVWTLLSKEPVGQFGEKHHDIVENDYGPEAKFGGTLTSVQPFVITNDDGKTLTGVPAKDAEFMLYSQVHKDVLLIGMSISGEAEVTPDGLLHAKNLSFRLRPGRPGALFGKVLAVHGRTLDVRPRFTSDTLRVTFTPNAHSARQIALDPDSVKIGDTLTVWGGASRSDAPKTDLTAYVLLVGKQAYPRAQQDPKNKEDQTRTGVVTALRPLTLKQTDGTSVTITVPGQTPVSDLRPFILSHLKPGDKVMVIGSMKPNGGLQAVDLIKDAPPVIGAGD